MGDSRAGQDSNTALIAGLALITCIIAHFIYKIFFVNKKTEEPIVESVNEPCPPTKNEAEKTASEKALGKKKRAQWKTKSDFSHPWLLKNLKGHPGTVLLMDFSANGKFMAATCDETAGSSDTAGAAARRRRPRDRRRSTAAPPSSSPSQRISTEELVQALLPHLLTSKRMWTLGYPMEIEPNKAVLYTNPPRQRNMHTTWDVNAPEFVPGGSQSDSGRGSMGSTPRSDSDEEVDAVEQLCVRCDKMFRMIRDGEYLTHEVCHYHWGRVGVDHRYGCCNAPVGTRGCTSARSHVWSGVRPGMNGPLDGYVRARCPRGGVYAIDAEMCYTTMGLELASIAVVAADGRLVYRSFVKQTSRVVDYNTRFSGIRARDLDNAKKTLKDVQNDILGFVGTDTILVGHALENDLRALKLLHGCVVDTSAMYPHARGFPLRRSLRALASELLGRTVQRSSGGHSPLEDARAAMDLVLLKVHEERLCPRYQPAPPPPPPPSFALLQPYDPLISAP